MVSINNNFGIGALKATAKAETAGIQKDDGQVTVKNDALFPQEPKMEKTHYPNTTLLDERLKDGDTFSENGIIYKVTIKYDDEGKAVKYGTPMAREI